MQRSTGSRLTGSGGRTQTRFSLRAGNSVRGPSLIRPLKRQIRDKLPLAAKTSFVCGRPNRLPSTRCCVASRWWRETRPRLRAGLAERFSVSIPKQDSFHEAVSYCPECSVPGIRVPQAASLRATSPYRTGSLTSARRAATVSSVLDKNRQTQDEEPECRSMRTAQGLSQGELQALDVLTADDQLDRAGALYAPPSPSH